MKSWSLEEIEIIESKVNKYKDTNIKNINEIDIINNIKIDENKEPEERVSDFLKEVINPYFLILMVMLLRFHIKRMILKLKNVFSIMQ